MECSTEPSKCSVPGSHQVSRPVTIWFRHMTWHSLAPQVLQVCCLQNIVYFARAVSWIQLPNTVTFSLHITISFTLSSIHHILFPSHLQVLSGGLARLSSLPPLPIVLFRCPTGAPTTKGRYSDLYSFGSSSSVSSNLSLTILTS